MNDQTIERWPRASQRAAAPLALLPTLLVAALFVVVDVRALAFHWPTHLLVFCVSGARFFGGRAAGLLSAAISSCLMAFTYTEPGHLFAIAEANRFRVLFDVSLLTLALALAGYVDTAIRARQREAALAATIAAERLEAARLRTLYEASAAIEGARDAAAARTEMMRILSRWLGATTARMWTKPPPSGDGAAAIAWERKATIVTGLGECADGPPHALAVPVLREGDVHAVAEFRFANAPAAAPGLTELVTMLELQVEELECRRKAEAAAARTDRQVRSILESTAEAIFGLDAQGLVTFANPAGMRLLGAESFAELRSADLHDLVHPQEDSPQCALRRALRTPVSTSSATDRFCRLDRTAIPVEYWCHAVDGADEDRMVLTAIDVSKRQELEAKLAQAQKMDSLGRLAGGVAHDFNNLLTVIIGSADMLAREETDARAATLRHIVIAAERASDLTRQLLAFSRRQLLELRDLDLNAVVGEALTWLARLIREDILLETSLSAQPCFVRADAGQLQQVLTNLVVNARDAMPAGGRLAIGVETVDVAPTDVPPPVTLASGPYVLLTVTDSGVGMDRETSARIFEPFFTTKQGNAGTGLGLATVFGIVKQMGGDIRVYSEPGKGATFKIYLPRIAVPSAAVAAAPVAPPDLSGHESILLVEDDALVRELTEKVLTAHGYRVVAAECGSAALAAAESAPGGFALLVTDMVLPDFNGAALYALLAARGVVAKAVFMSGYAHEAAFDGAAAPGSTVLIQKPFAPTALAESVRRVLDAEARRA